MRFRTSIVNMSDQVVGITPALLKWARERCGVTLEDVAAQLHKPVETIQNWEIGNDAPTYPQLETLAYKIYKRPLALFFFPEPPEEPGPRQAFRTLPDWEVHDLSSETRYRIRQAMALQSSLRELYDGTNPSERKVFRELDFSDLGSATIFSVRHFLNLVEEKKRLTGRPVADPFLIACAKVRGWSVVTEEKLKPHAAKIPNVCEHFNVRWTNVEGFLKSRGWTF